jgi:hypothetical protein
VIDLALIAEREEDGSTGLSEDRQEFFEDSVTWTQN